MARRHRNHDLKFPKDFRFIYGSRLAIAGLSAEEVKDHAIFMFTSEIPKNVEHLRPMHQSLIPTSILFEKYHPQCFKFQDALGDMFVRLAKNSTDKRGIIFMCEQGEIRSKEMAYVAHLASDQPYFEAKCGKLIPGSKKTTDLLFRVVGPVFDILTDATFE